MRRCRLQQLSLLFAFFLGLVPAWAQEPGAQQVLPITIHPLKLWGYPKSIDQFKGVAPDITLTPCGEGARHGQIWVRTIVRPGPTSGPAPGLYIAGKVDGAQPDFPLTRDLIPSKDHIEIWLAGSRDVDLPPIGWNNQFERITLPKGAESCQDWAKNDAYAQGEESEKLKKCQEWAESQVRYREYFKRLFVRQWQLGPREQIEAYATPAFERITDWYGGDWLDQFMKPQRKLELFEFFPESSGYSFEVFIPFEAFPPLPNSDTRELLLLVDVFNAAPTGKTAGVYSTSSPVRVWGNPSSFNVLRLDPPFSCPLTFCNLPLGETPEERKEHLTWALPTSLRTFVGINVLSDTFVVENMFICGGWDPGGLSPWVRRTHHFEMGTKTGVWVCGPNLTIAKGDKSAAFPYVIGEEGLDYKQMPDGQVLVKTGPRVWSLEGQACFPGSGAPITDLQIFDLSKDMQLQRALSLSDTIYVNLESQDFTLSADWSQVTRYDLRSREESWSSTTWCLKANGEKGYSYEKCAEKENVQPPNPPVLKELRQGLVRP